MTDKKLSNLLLCDMVIEMEDSCNEHGTTLEMFQFGPGFHVLKHKREGVNNRWVDEVFQSDLTTVEDIVEALEGDGTSKVVTVTAGENYLYVK